MKKIYQASIAVLSLLAAHQSYAQSCTMGIASNTPESRYEILKESNGAEVMDKQTGLIWQRCSLGQVWINNSCIGTPSIHTWSSALKRVKELGNGYRLPNIKELQTLVSETCEWPAINETIFPQTEIYRRYLSSTTSPLNHVKHTDGDDSTVWGVIFELGSTAGGYKQDRTFNIRAVRVKNP